MSKPCPLCLEFSGRYNMNLQCCQIRFLSYQPKGHREAHYDQVRKQQGQSALNQLQAIVQQEQVRRRKWQVARASVEAPGQQLF